MASKDKLTGSFGSLSDTLALRWDPGFPAEVADRWIGAMMYVAAIGQRRAEWTALPQASSSSDPVITELDGGTHKLVVATTSATRIDALGKVKNALDLLNALMDEVS